MNQQATTPIATLNYYPKGNSHFRSFALWYFASLITVWTIVGHMTLGFGQSWAQPLTALGVACGAQILLEYIDAKATDRKPRYTAGAMAIAILLLPAWISGIAIGMILYTSSLLAPIAFAAALAISSKVIFRAPVGKTTQHIFNPSNIGITGALLLFPWIGIAGASHFTENATGIWNWVVPGAILCTGVFLHAKSTGRLPMVLAWIFGFILQGLVRDLLFGLPWPVQLMPITGAPFILFTLYMIPDPATSPIDFKWQIAFGLSIAALYGLLLVLHVPYGLFLSLSLVSALRGIGLYILDFQARRSAAPAI
jgi:hypothetical protein